MSTASYTDPSSPVLSATCTGSNGVAVSAFTGATNGKGVWAQCNGTDGWAVLGIAALGSNSRGIVGSGGFAGVFGESHAAGGYGVYGQSLATSGVTYGVYGRSSSAAGYGVFSLGKFAATGTKSAVVPSSKGHIELYAEEATEVWFSDYGEGRLVQGQARIDLDPHFLETVAVNERIPFKVFVQLEGEAGGVYVRKDSTGFDVIELQHGKSDAPFSYRIVAKRKGYEEHRLCPVTISPLLHLAGTDPGAAELAAA